MMKTKGIGGHQSANMRTDEWLTPPSIIKALGEFDMDPCSPINRPWPTAKNHLTILDNGLKQEWAGRVWLNPPYGKEAARWLNKLAHHNNGIALIFARTETDMFFSEVWAKADAGAPSVLIAYGENNAAALRHSGIQGKYLDIKQLKQSA